MIAKIPLRVDTGLVICVKYTGLLSIGKLYATVKSFGETIYVRADDGTIRAYNMQYFKPYKYKAGTALKDFT